MRDIEIVWGPNREFIKRLTQEGTKFLVIGGTAVRFQAPERRAPDDLDLLVGPSLATLKMLNAALVHVGAATITAAPEQFVRGNGAARCKGINNPLNVDVFTPPTGVEFGEHWVAAKEAVMHLSSTRVRVASIPTLEVLLRIGMDREPVRAPGIVEDLELLARYY